jgi:biotin operon repressor
VSLDATRWAWKIQSIRPLHKLILLALADRANSDDTAWPSYELLTTDTGVDRKTTWKAIKSMKAAGLLVDTGERKGKTGQVQMLRLIGVSRRSDEVKESLKGNDSENGTVPFFPAKDSENGILNSSENGIRNLPIEPTSRTKRVLRAENGARLPDDWSLPDEWGAWAIQHLTWTPDRCRAVADRFADFWRGLSGAKARKVDWFATWRNWCRTDNDKTPPTGRHPKTENFNGRNYGHGGKL